MPKLVYVYGDDRHCLDTLVTSLRNNGYAVEYADAPEPMQGGGIRADIALICKPAVTSNRYDFAGLTLDLDKVCAYDREHNEIHLTPNELSLFCHLMRNATRVVPRKELLSAVWGLEDDSTTRVVDDTIKRLRKKLVGSGVAIETVWGYGFRLREEG